VDPELGPIFDLTQGPNANWREILRNNPDDPRFKWKPGMPKAIYLGPLDSRPAKKRSKRPVWTPGL
jgi:hypothetical protein